MPLSAHSITVEERAEMQCVLERVGGPEGMAGFEWQDGGLDPVFMGAMMQCKVRRPSAGPSPQAPVQTLRDRSDQSHRGGGSRVPSGSVFGGRTGLRNGVGWN